MPIVPRVREKEPVEGAPASVRRRAAFRKSFPVLLVGLLLTAFVGAKVHDVIETHVAEHFLEGLRNVLFFAEAGFKFETHELYRLRAFFFSSESVTPDEWRRFNDVNELRRVFPSISVVRYLERVPRERLAAFESERAQAQPGFPERVFPDTGGSEAYVVKYVSPETPDNLSSLGFDALSDPVRRQAYARSVETDAPSVSGPFVRRDDQKTGKRSFLIALAVFAPGADVSTPEARRKALTGVVEMVSGYDKFFQNIQMYHEKQPAVGFAVYEGTSESPHARIYAKNFPEGGRRPRFTAALAFQAVDRTWTARFVALPEFNDEEAHDEMLVFVLVGGALLSLALFALFYVQAGAETRAEEVVAERTRELREAMRVKTDFTSTVSHELRTPLSVIREGVALVEDGTAGPVNAEQKEFLELAKNNVDRLARLINDVLDFQKLEAMRMPFRLKPYDLNAVVAQSAREFELMAHEKGLVLSLEPEPGLPEVAFDSDRILQVLGNYLSNAIRFSEKGRVVLRTRLASNAVCVSVTDEGPGISAEDQKRLFQSFVQVGEERKAGGTGLGLVISKKIVEAHGGRVGVESVKGRGSTFWFTLPVVRG